MHRHRPTNTESLNTSAHVYNDFEFRINSITHYECTQRQIQSNECRVLGDLMVCMCFSTIVAFTGSLNSLEWLKCIHKIWNIISQTYWYSDISILSVIEVQRRPNQIDRYKKGTFQCALDISIDNGILIFFSSLSLGTSNIFFLCFTIKLKRKETKF